MDLKLILVDKINQKETMPRYSIPQPLFIPENLIQFIDGLHAVHGKSIKIQLLVKTSVSPVLSQHHVVLRRNLPSAHIGADLLPLFFHQYQEGCLHFLKNQTLRWWGEEIYSQEVQCPPRLLNISVSTKVTSIPAMVPRIRLLSFIMLSSEYGISIRKSSSDTSSRVPD